MLDAVTAVAPMRMEKAATDSSSETVEENSLIPARNSCGKPICVLSVNSDDISSLGVRSYIECKKNITTEYVRNAKKGRGFKSGDNFVSDLEQNRDRSTGPIRLRRPPRGSAHKSMSRNYMKKIQSDSFMTIQKAIAMHDNLK